MNPETQARIDTLHVELHELQLKVNAAQIELWDLLAATDEEDDAVTDSLLDRAHDCPEAMAEDLELRICELEALRQMRVEEEDAELEQTRIPADAKAETREK